MKINKIVIIVVIVFIIFMCLISGILYVALGGKRNEVSTVNEQSTKVDDSIQEEDSTNDDNENKEMNDEDNGENRGDTQTENEKFIIDINEIKYITMPLKDNDDEYLKTIRVTDENEINEIVSEINKAEEHPNFEEEVGETGILNNTPILVIDFNDGSKNIIYTMNNFSGGGEQTINIMRTIYAFNEREIQSPIYEIKTDLNALIQKTAQKHAE